MNLWDELRDEIRQTLPQPPARVLFDNDEEHRQAMGMWEMLVARLIGTRHAGQDVFRRHDGTAA